MALDRLAAERVLHHWERALPDDRRPRRILALAEGLLDGTVDPETAHSETMRFSPLDMPDVGDGGRAGLAAAAAQAAVTTAFGGELTDDYAPPGSDDMDLDPDMWDGAFYASLPEGPEFAPDDVEARRAFWCWWLNEAVLQVARETALDLDQ